MWFCGRDLIPPLCSGAVSRPLSGDIIVRCYRFTVVKVYHNGTEVELCDSTAAAALYGGIFLWPQTCTAMVRRLSFAAVKLHYFWMAVLFGVAKLYHHCERVRLL